MTRQIKFRAKRSESDEWVYGSYYHFIIEGYEDIPQHRILLENHCKGRGFLVDIDENT